MVELVAQVVERAFGEADGNRSPLVSVKVSLSKKLVPLTAPDEPMLHKSLTWFHSLPTSKF